jgi:hypothetical protein
MHQLRTVQYRKIKNFLTAILKKLVVKSALQRIPSSMSGELDFVVSAWGRVAGDIVIVDSRGFAQLMVRTLRCIQSMSYADMCVISAIESRISTTEVGSHVDRELHMLFRDMLSRCTHVYGSHLSLDELLDAYSQILRFSSSDPDSFSQIRREVSHHLLSRIAAGEKIPLKFNMHAFVGTFISDLNESHLPGFSDWCLHRVKSLHTNSNSSPTLAYQVTSDLLTIQKVFDTLHVAPTADFELAVKICVSY